jgi:catechol 2,3-dioxygenase-like lactoylglutathione lyase family enzyme
MEIKFAHNVVFVKDIEVSKQFYCDILGIKIIQDHKIFILFENNFAIHQAKEVIIAIYKSDKSGSNELQGRNNIDIYFESDDIERAYQQLLDKKVKIIHPIERQSWGQRVIRFYDPDNHIVEIGEPSFIKFN